MEVLGMAGEVVIEVLGMAGEVAIEVDGEEEEFRDSLSFLVIL